MKFILLAACSVQGQEKKDTGKWNFSSSSSGPVSIGYVEGKTSVMMNLKDSSLHVSGPDSMAVIKLLWKQLNEANKREFKLWRMYGKSQDDFVRLANAWQKANEELKKDLEKMKGKNK